MSVKNTEITGDIAVGRNIRAGGMLDVKGNAVVRHNLRVEGWLDANNIKGANKGVFETEAALRAAYPAPEEGWFAGVGTSTPFAAYIAKEGAWVATGGEITVELDVNAYEETKEIAERAHAVAEQAEARASQAEAAVKAVVEVALDGKELAEVVNRNTIARFVDIIDDVPESLLVPTVYTGERLYDGICESIHYVRKKQVFVYVVPDGHCYKAWRPGWGSAELRISRGEEQQYNDEGLTHARTNQLYLHSGTGMLYYVNKALDLVPVQGELTRIEQRIEVIEQAVGAVGEVANEGLAVRSFVNANTLLNTDDVMPLKEVLARIESATPTASSLPRRQGLVLTFKGSGGWQSWQWDGGEWNDESCWRRFDGLTVVGSSYNISKEMPTQDGYYDLPTAIGIAWKKGYNAVGTQITFEDDEDHWVTYQYIGSNSSEATFKRLSNWVSMVELNEDIDKSLSRYEQIGEIEILDVLEDVLI